VKTKIYILRHPLTAEIRYAGKTIYPLSIRLSNHISDAKKRQNGSRYVLNWIRKIHPLVPDIELVCEVDGNGNVEETACIKRLRESGCRLTNLTDGGEGMAGHKPVFTAEHRAKISAAKMGHAVTAETRAKLRAASLGHKASLEVRAKLSARLMGNRHSVGRKHSAETKAKMSAAHKGNKNAVGHKWTDEQKARASAFHKGRQYALGRKLSPEHKEKISRGNKGLRRSLASRAKLSAAAKLREAKKRAMLIQPQLELREMKT
jgi:hypothetical protein